MDSLLSSKCCLRLLSFQFRLDFGLCSATALWQKVLTGKDGFRERGALGHLSFGGPKQV